MKLEKILVPVDFSSASAAVEPYASWAEHRAAEEMKVFLGPKRKKNLTAAIVTGEVSSRILQIAEDGDFDLIVMGTRGRTGLGHLLVGSTAEWTLRHAHCPVLTTHAAGRHSGSARNATASASDRSARNRPVTERRVARGGASERLLLFGDGSR